MADSEVNPPVKGTGKAENAESTKQESGIDAAIDAALGRVASSGSGDPENLDVPLKRQWDKGLEAELEAALAGFDPASVGSDPRRASGSRKPSSTESDRGQEIGPGARTGKVIGVRGKSIFVDLGGKSEGVLPLDQFEGDLPLPGSTIEVVVNRFDPEEGIQVLSRKGAAIDADWTTLRKGVIVEARVTKTVKGGLEVDVDGIRGFLPISQIDLSRVDDAASYVNQKFKALVTEANQREKNLVISRRELLEGAADKYRRGTQVMGKVSRIMDFGAFVELEPGVEGLIHITELSPNRVRRVADIVKPDQEVEVRILKVEPAERRIALSLKPSPKAAIAEETDEEAEGEGDKAPPPPRPEPKIPLKGGLGDRERRQK
jgi:small subunit ribosomal protein S1